MRACTEKGDAILVASSQELLAHDWLFISGSILAWERVIDVRDDWPAAAVRRLWAMRPQEWRRRRHHEEGSHHVGRELGNPAFGVISQHFKEVFVLD